MAMIALFLSVCAIALSIWSIANSMKWRKIYEERLSDTVRPSSPDLIEHYKEAMDKYPEHSPKWKAYRNRLVDMGVLDGDR